MCDFLEISEDLTALNNAPQVKSDKQKQDDSGQTMEVLSLENRTKDKDDSL